MWQHNYIPVGNSLPLSALVAALPIFVLLFMLGVVRKAAWISSLAGLVAAMLVAYFAYGMPPAVMLSPSVGWFSAPFCFTTSR